MSQAPSTRPGTYSLAKAQDKCQVCHNTINPDQKFMASLREIPTGLERLDICDACWGNFDKSNLLAYWHATMRPATAKKQIFVDDEVLCDLFARLGDTQEPAKLQFRFVLGLILMRKRRIAYESTRTEGEKEIWSVRFRGKEELLDLLNPKLDEQQIGQVSTQLGEILDADL